MPLIRVPAPGLSCGFLGNDAERRRRLGQVARAHFALLVATPRWFAEIWLLHGMAHFSSEDEEMLQAMLRQLFQSVKEKITGAPSLECAEEILLRLEETDENFHK